VEGSMMATGELGKVLQQLRAAYGPDQDDASLLESFLARHDESAFAVLVRRHGPMVLGVCRRVLQNEADAEDAFQATFLVLVRKAGSVVRRGVIGSWLFGVAHRTALEARRAAARRRVKEASVMHPSRSAPETPDGLREVLDQELAALPVKFRAPLVLCDIEGKTRREAARELGVPEGTVASRVARARLLLAKRLANHGLSLSAGALAATLSEAAVAVPHPLVGLTVKAAALLAAGHASCVATPVILMKGVLESMFLTKIKVISAALMLAVTFGACSLVYRAARADSSSHAGDSKSRTDPEGLRKEIELLRLNLLLVLEKVRSQEEELRGLKARAQATQSSGVIFNLDPLQFNAVLPQYSTNFTSFGQILTGPNASIAPYAYNGFLVTNNTPLLQNLVCPSAYCDPVKDVEEASKALRDAKDKGARKRAADALEKALKKVRNQLEK
jgi:RNA polymerase sigma factor (sigma-70 family)